MRRYASRKELEGRKSQDLETVSDLLDGVVGNMDKVRSNLRIMEMTSRASQMANMIGRVEGIADELENLSVAKSQGYTKYNKTEEKRELIEATQEELTYIQDEMEDLLSELVGLGASKQRKKLERIFDKLEDIKFDLELVPIKKMNFSSRSFKRLPTGEEPL